MYLATAAQMKEIDRIAIEERGISSLELMENAAKAVVGEILALSIPGPKRHRQAIAYVTRDGREPSGEEQAAFWASRQRSAIIFCGPGNNGGDGLAVARLLLGEGWRVKCLLVGNREKMTPDSRGMERRLIETGGVLEDFCPENWADYRGFDVAVDAIFGVGLNSDLRPDAVEAVRAMASAWWTVAVDVPSGIHADTGEILGRAVKADLTVTFTLAKRGLFVGEGAVHSGRVVVADIGIPRDLYNDEEAFPVTTVEKPVLSPRRREAHKGDFGKVFILAGSRGFTGAPCLAARAAVRSGAGLVTVAVTGDIYPIVAAKCCDEAMVWPIPDSCEELLEKAKTADIVLIGPGLGQSRETEECALSLLREITCPIVLDADGLNIISRHIDVLDKRSAPTVLTPHDGEFARLTGCELPIHDRLAAAREFVERHRCVLVLKGHRTITAASGGQGHTRCFINTTGNPGMAQGGSGDALAGFLASLCAQKEVDDILAAIWLHGRAGDLAAAEKGERGMTVTDLIEAIPYAMKECEEE
ncbi:MAG: NAD(P)H-hydrate dehydratase [Oscillospiraceae bacterium]|jgi:hydroxyethylthiazole kinase-like uncharacterized protein yjeF|nr:NAD(P)H-hydrate dehydratase [Oscillospiraceae bacterium]